MNPLLSDIEQKVRDQASELAEKHIVPLALEIDTAERCPDQLVKLLCARISEQPDEASAAPMHLALRVEQVARHSAAAASIAATHGVGVLIAQERYLAEISGSDIQPVYVTVYGASGLSAEVSADRTVLRGSVELVAGAAHATTLLVACEQGTNAGVYAVLADHEGITIGPPQAMIGLAGSGTASVTCNEVILTSTARVGDAELARKVVDVARVAQAAQAVGIASGALEAALRHITAAGAAADVGDPPQATQWMLADIATETEAARLLVWHAALQLGVGDAREAAAACRLLAAEAAVAASRRAVQIAGDQGALRYSVFDRLYRDAKLMEVLGGTNEDQLGVIADGLLPGMSS